jgi:hypothetical protein
MNNFYFPDSNPISSTKDDTSLNHRLEEDNIKDLINTLFSLKENYDENDKKLNELDEYLKKKDRR